MKFEPQVQETHELRAKFNQQRAHLVAELERMYELYTQRKRPVSQHCTFRDFFVITNSLLF